nr:putative ribonuclease H protein At1g65750 family [Tanacetum cinerariifolium]
MDLNLIQQLHRENLRQRIRLRWAAEGDENTRLFHSLLKCKYLNFSSKGIQASGTWIESPDDIKLAAIEYFSSRFKDHNYTRPYFNSLLFSKLFVSEACYLESNFTMEEVRCTVWGCVGSKASGPDGFNFNFIKANWEEFKMERGLHQGDPLSPFLFLIVAEALQVSILEDCNKGLYNGVSLANNDTNVSLLQYADDALFFGECIGVASVVVFDVASSLGCAFDTIPFIYIGLPVENAFWRLVIKEFYEVDGGFNSPANTHGVEGVWCNILKVVKRIESIDVSFNRSFTRSLSDGSNTIFWKDVWGENREHLMDKFPRLFAFETDKDCRVSDRLRLENNF